MKGTPILLENMEFELETDLARQHGIGVGLGILAIVAVAAAWNIALVLFHNLMARLLSCPKRDVSLQMRRPAAQWSGSPSGSPCKF